MEEELIAEEVGAENIYESHDETRNNDSGKSSHVSDKVDIGENNFNSRESDDHGKPHFLSEEYEEEPGKESDKPSDMSSKLSLDTVKKQQHSASKIGTLKLEKHVPIISSDLSATAPVVATFATKSGADDEQSTVAERLVEEYEEELRRRREGDEETLLASKMTGLGVSRQVSPDEVLQLQLQFGLPKHQKKKQPDAAASSEKQKTTLPDWSDAVWLRIAARQTALRRSRKAADIELRKKKYPELYRSDASICPSYTDFKLPYFAVCRQRYARAMRQMTKQFEWDINEMALLQPRALDGVRMVRSFSQGARPERLPDLFSRKEKSRLEKILARD